MKARWNPHFGHVGLALAIGIVLVADVFASPPSRATAPAVGQIVLEEDLILAEAGPDEVLGRIHSVGIGRDGTIYVGDSGFGRIHAFDPDGTHLRSFGQTGEGPGDLPAPYFSMTVDTRDPQRDLLLIAGNRSFVSWLDSQGDLVRSVSLGTLAFPRAVAPLPSGEIALSYVNASWGAEIVNPLMVHVHGEDGALVRSFAASSWWRPEEHDPRWASALLIGAAHLSSDETSLVYVQGQPFELRTYDLLGQLLNSTTAGLHDFIPEPRLPDVDGDTTSFIFTGSASAPLLAVDGKIFIAATRLHPDDADPSQWREGEPPRRQNRLVAFSDELRWLAEGELAQGTYPVAFDREGRLWFVRSVVEPELVRMRVSLEPGVERR